MEDGSTKEEWKMVAETKKILDPKIKLTATCVRVPVFVGHSEAVNIEFDKPISPDEARDILRDAPGVSVIDKREAGGYATPIEAVGEYDTYVSRIREDETVENGLSHLGGLRQPPQGRRAQHRADPRDADRAQAGRAQSGLSAATATAVSLRDILLALAVVVVWGVNFVAIRWGVDEVPPLLLTALRYVVCRAAGGVLHPPPDRSGSALLVAYGLAIGVGQFGLLFVAIKLGMPAGLGSLVMQLQVFFTIVLAVLFFGERPKPAQLAGALVAFAGIGVIALERLEGAALVPLLMTIAAARLLGRRQHRHQEGRAGSTCSASSSGRAWCRRSRCSLLVAALRGAGRGSLRAQPHHLAAASARCCSSPGCRRSSATAPGACCSAAIRRAWSRRSRCWCPIAGIAQRGPAARRSGVTGHRDRRQRAGVRRPAAQRLRPAISFPPQASAEGELYASTETSSGNSGRHESRRSRDPSPRVRRSRYRTRRHAP